MLLLFLFGIAAEINITEECSTNYVIQYNSTLSINIHNLELMLFIAIQSTSFESVTYIANWDALCEKNKVESAMFSFDGTSISLTSMINSKTNIEIRAIPKSICPNDYSVFLFQKSSKIGFSFPDISKKVCLVPFFPLNPVTIYSDQMDYVRSFIYSNGTSIPINETKQKAYLSYVIYTESFRVNQTATIYIESDFTTPKPFISDCYFVNGAKLTNLSYTPGQYHQLISCALEPSTSIWQYGVSALLGLIGVILICILIYWLVKKCKNSSCCKCDHVEKEEAISRVVLSTETPLVMMSQDPLVPSDESRSVVFYERKGN